MFANQTPIRDLAQYTTLPILNNKTLGNWELVVPPSTKEQKEIADYLDSRCAAINSIIAEKEALIADLEAYKKSLIYEEVTGKRRVTEDNHAA